MRKAVPMFEGVQAFVDHPSSEEEKTGRRSVRNLAGKYTNARFTDGKVRGDAHLLPNENGKLYMDIAENMPDIAGNSQNATGLWRKENGVQVVEQLTKVFSVDLVASPATTRGMFESHNTQGDNDMEWNELTGALLLAHRPDIHEVILGEGQKTRDDEVNKLTETNKSLKLKIDEYEVKEAAVAKAVKIDELIESEKLHKDAVTDTFKESLVAAKDDETVKKLITDRKEIYESSRKGVKNMGGGQVQEGRKRTADDTMASLRS